jgi:hypothetical protein
MKNSSITLIVNVFIFVGGDGGYIDFSSALSVLFASEKISEIVEKKAKKIIIIYF